MLDLLRGGAPARRIVLGALVLALLPGCVEARPVASASVDDEDVDGLQETPSGGGGALPVLRDDLQGGGGRADCAGLVRRLKLGAMDQMWGGVLEDSNNILRGCDGAPAEMASYYRARALDRLRRHDQALPAYREFLDEYCVSGESFLCEDATVSLYSLAAERVRKGDPDKVKILLEGLRAGDFYTKVFAGIQIAKLPGNDAAKEKALPLLVEAYRLEDDRNFQNEICLAIIQVDPTKCGGGAAGSPGDEDPSWIRVRVWDCHEKIEKVKVNLPFSFAAAAIEALGPEILHGIEAEGFDLENMWASLRKLQPNERFSISINDDDQCMDIEIWFD